MELVSYLAPPWSFPHPIDWRNLGMLGYYLPGILTLVGITKTQQQLGINLGMTVASYLSTVIGALIIDRVTRRLLLMGTMIVFIFFLAIMALTGGLYANDVAQSTIGIVTIVAIYLFQISNGLLCKLMLQLPKFFLPMWLAVLIAGLQHLHFTTCTPPRCSITASELRAWGCTRFSKIALDLQ